MITLIGDQPVPSPKNPDASMSKALWLIALLAFLIYAFIQGSHPDPPDHPMPQPTIAPQVFTPTPGVPHFPGLDNLDDAWFRGPCGHFHDVVVNGQYADPCRLV